MPSNPKRASQKAQKPDSVSQRVETPEYVSQRVETPVYVSQRVEKPRYPSQTLDQYMLRLPDGMRDRIKAAAEVNNRSMNAEIVATLEKAYPAPITFDEEHFRHLVEMLSPLMHSNDEKDRKALRYVAEKLAQPSEKQDILRLIAYLIDHQKRPRD